MKIFLPNTQSNMYCLSLNWDDRMVIDSIQGQFPTGNSFKDLLKRANCALPWDTDGTITFFINEKLAWEIYDLMEDCLDEYHHFPVYDDELGEKIWEFCKSVP